MDLFIYQLFDTCSLAEFSPLQLEDAVCGDTGGHFNPFNVDKSSSPPNGQGSRYIPILLLKLP